MRSLRSRLIISHVLPLLVIVPVVGIALIYVLETQVVLENLSRELQGQAALVAELAVNQSEIWVNESAAEAFVARTSEQLPARVMLLDTEGRMLASSDPADAEQQGQILNLPEYPDVLMKEVSVHVDYSQQSHAEVADVLVPVVGSDQKVVGVVRLTHRLATVYDRFLRLRYLILGILAAGLVLGAGVGLTLAFSLEQPVRRVTQAVYQLAAGNEQITLPEQGPEELRVLARAFNTLTERLHSLETARRQLLANLVHELGRPLGALRSATQALLAGADKDESLRRELLAGMDAHTAELQQLLNDLTRLHDRVIGDLELDRRPTELYTWLPGVLAPWKEAAHGKDLHWETSLPDALPTVIVDPERLGQALGNLVSNAIKYTPAGGTVSVGAGTDDSDVWIRVSDTGPGIPVEEQERIFAPFHRVRAGRRFPEGMGLGLSIARDLVVAHGGRVEVDSTPGEGSQFTMHIPANGTDRTT